LALAGAAQLAAKAQAKPAATAARARGRAKAPRVSGALLFTSYLLKVWVMTGILSASILFVTSDR
jgi:hypothetical protein